MTESSTAAEPSAIPGTRLHIGSGRHRLPGWTNLDIQALPEVDRVVDVRDGLDFENVQAIYAEHFLEHLAVDDALNFLAECHRVLIPGGWLRLSTPNLDWVWRTHYVLDADADEKQMRALMLNRAFHGWRHRFLWNQEILGRALVDCGFEDLRWCRYGESTRPELAGVEGHETYDDTDDLPHVVIVEACRGDARPKKLAALRKLVYSEFLAHQQD